MRIVFLAVDDEFAGAMQRFVYDRHPEWIVGSVISSSTVYKKSQLGAAIFVLRRSGGVYLAEMARMKLLRKFFDRSPRVTPSELPRAHGVETYVSGDINTKADRARLAEWRPDVVISTNFNHYVGSKVREQRPTGVWNLHKSYLPRYRGMAPSFYTLLQGAESVGATLHVMAKGFDTGDIIEQVEVPVEEGDTVYTLNKKVSERGGRMLAELLESVDPSQVVTTKQTEGDWPNNSYPSRAAVREFRAKGLKF